MNLCVIPARGGSKRISKKNIKEFHGNPQRHFRLPSPDQHPDSSNKYSSQSWRF